MKETRAFVSYRRDDTESATARLVEALRKRFGAEAVYHDQENLRGGKKWKEELRRELSQDAVVLVIIGKRWLKIGNEDSGQRRLDEEGDPVRIEIELALQSNPAPALVPVLVGDAAIPRAGQLPDSIRDLASYHVHRLKESPEKKWEADLEGLFEVLKEYGFEAQRTAQPSEARSSASGRRERRPGYLDLAEEDGVLLWRVKDELLMVNSIRNQIELCVRDAASNRAWSEPDRGRYGQILAKAATQPSESFNHAVDSLVATLRDAEHHSRVMFAAVEQAGADLSEVTFVENLASEVLGDLKLARREYMSLLDDLEKERERVDEWAVVWEYLRPASGFLDQAVSAFTLLSTHIKSLAG